MDAATDLYTITTYYKSPEIVSQAIALLAMVLLNLFIQTLIVYGTNKKTSGKKVLKEVMITLFFLRPAVNAYRVCTNHTDGDSTVESLDFMILNKCTELATEAIPGCVLQIYVWLAHREQVGT